MTPDTTPGRARFALLLNGSSFACEALKALHHAGVSPDLLVLPEYPPAAVPANSLLEATAAQPLEKLAGDIEIDYVPQAQQARFAQRLRREKFDFLLVACWPYLIERAVVDSVRRLALNLHPSMLPAYRGPDPIGEQLEHGESHPGVSLHLLSPRFDTGDILVQSRLPASMPWSDRVSLERACARLGCRLFIDALSGYDAGWQLTPQANIGQTPELQ